MKTARVLAPVAAMVALAGCCTIPDMISLLPLIPEAEAVFDDALLGKWQVKGESEILDIVRSGDKGYLIQDADPSKKDDDPLHVTLGRIGGILFLDISSSDKPGHLFAKITFDRDHIEVMPMKLDWLKGKVVKQGQLTYMELPYGNCGVQAIAAPPRELQYFMLRYATDPEAFEPAMELTRMN